MNLSEDAPSLKGPGPNFSPVQPISKEILIVIYFEESTNQGIITIMIGNMQPFVG
ncbi:hypothetical protein KIN20_035366 [Parelaphostrongylus tenuis]|uniref:Uncharacterized protein n=1 Tax=Parelaphostrongylus tenuis TaxID=148309 RepID=A0AAD5WJM5_PARTN|nr:hypothetical protein KIN20_035366 [Parelaphostrongylus tenuis]